jgi:hypothetical protein
MRATTLSLVLLGLLVPASAEAGVRNFFLPEFQGTRVDACLTGGTCGKPAADAFCKVQGYDNALIFQREASAQTRRIDSGELCSTSACVAFKQVKCFTEKTDLAALSP